MAGALGQPNFNTVVHMIVQLFIPSLITCKTYNIVKSKDGRMVRNCHIICMYVH